MAGAGSRGEATAPLRRSNATPHPAELRRVSVAALSVIALVGILTPSGPAKGQQFVDFVVASPFADGDHWFLLQDLRYDVLDTGVTVVVPAGFATDFASIPQPFWSLLPRWGKHGAPAIVHDYLYWDQSCTREEADRLMRIAMRENRVGVLRRGVIHAALRIGGAFAWRQNAKLRRQGYVRVIPRSEYPQDPNTRWHDLQQRLKEQGVRPPHRDDAEAKPDYCLIGG